MSILEQDLLNLQRNLKANNISHILNCAPHQCQNYFNDGMVVYHQVEMRDHTSFKIEQAVVQALI